MKAKEWTDTPTKTDYWCLKRIEGKLVAVNEFGEIFSTEHLPAHKQLDEFEFLLIEEALEKEKKNHSDFTKQEWTNFLFLLFHKGVEFR